MLTGKNNLDAMYREKLRNYYVNPPEYIWDNIDKNLDNNLLRSTISKVAGIAASILLLLFSGLWLNKSLYSDKEIATNTNSPTESLITNKQTDTANKVLTPEKQAFYSMASFGADPSFAEKNHGTLSSGDEPIAFDIEKKIRTHFQSDRNVLNKISDLFIPSESKGYENKNSMRDITVFFNSIKESGTASTETFQGNAKNYSRWSIGVGTGPGFTWGFKSLPGQTTQAENSLTLGISGIYKISKKIGIKSGLFFNQIKQKTKLTDPSITELKTPSGFIKWNSTTLPETETLQQIKQEFSYVEIPLLLDYKFIDQKISVGVTGGISTNILTKNKATALDYSGNSQSGETAGIRDIAYAGVLGMEFGYNIGKRVSIVIEPHLTHYLHSLSSDSKTFFKPTQLGIFTGVSYSFN